MSSSPDRPLLADHPQLAGRLPWTALAELPTPVERLPALERHLGLGEVWVKRDDLTSPIYGGNKVRKLELVLADASRRGHRQLWTMGGIGSNHVLATAIHGGRLGFRTSAAAFVQPSNAHVEKNMRAMAEAGCSLHVAPHMWALPWAGLKLAAQQAREWAHRGAERPYWIPAGGSSPLGGLGYVSAALELAAQIEAGLCPLPEAIFVTLGSGGTAAGLIIGLRLAGLEIPVYCVRVVERAFCNATMLAGMCRRVVALLDRHGVAVRGSFEVRDLRVVHGYVGRGYGYATLAGHLAIDALAEDGLHLDPIYTGKTAAAMMDHVQGRGEGYRRMLYWHTLNSARFAFEKDSPRGRSPAD